jgi:hypothetical protein
MSSKTQQATGYSSLCGHYENAPRFRENSRMAGCPAFSIPPETSGCPVLRAFGLCEGRDSMICPAEAIGK